MKRSFLRQVGAIARRELASQFHSPIAYVVLTGFFVVAAAWLLVVDDPTTNIGFFDENEASLRRLFDTLPLIFVFFVPAISMRLIADEKRTGTLELLASWPVSDAAIVLGKFAGGLAIVLVALIGLLPLVVLVSDLGPLDLGAVASAFVGLGLFGAALLAIGVMTSAWTRNQIIAYLVAALFAGLFLSVDRMGSALGASAESALAALSFRTHLDNAARGVVDLRDLVFHGSFIAVALVIATQSLGARRWKG